MVQHSKRKYCSVEICPYGHFTYYDPICQMRGKLSLRTQMDFLLIAITRIPTVYIISLILYRKAKKFHETISRNHSDTKLSRERPPRKSLKHRSSYNSTQSISAYNISLSIHKYENGNPVVIFTTQLTRWQMVILSFTAGRKLLEFHPRWLLLPNNFTT